MDLPTLDLDVLNFIQVPNNYPPSTYEIVSHIQNHFYDQCVTFLKNQRKFHDCSKKIEKKLAVSISDSQSLNERVKERGDKLQKINRELTKINKLSLQYEKRQSFLGEVCKFINMEQARKILLQPKIVNESQFLKKIVQVDNLSQQIQNLNSDVKIISQIKQQLSLLLKQATNKLIKGSLSQSLISKLITNYSDLFLRDPKVGEIFLSNLVNHRLNLFRVALNPLINNLNYAQNSAELYQKIVEQWIRMLDDEIKMSSQPNIKPQIKQITSTVMQTFLAEVIPKIERGIYKIKSQIDVSRVRAAFLKLKKKFDELQGEAVWESLAKILVKTLIMLYESLEHGAQQLSIAKYNIHSLTSYVPIREYLETIKTAKSYDPNNPQIDWERGFKRLADSRDPSKQPNNKSLLIFNLNIWYLYIHIMKNQGELRDKAEQMLKEWITAFVAFNITPLKKQYQSKTVQKVIDLCADLEAVKKILYAETNLIGHQKMRTQIQKQLVQTFVVEIYSPLLTHNNLQEGMPTQKVVQLCKAQKINLNKYGKQGQKIKIISDQQIRDFL